MSRPTPRTLRRAAVAGGVLAGLAVPSAAFAAGPSSQATVLTTDNKISTFETIHPEEATAPVLVTDSAGTALTDKLVGIDVRPQNGYLYALGLNEAGNAIQLYSLSARTATATKIGGQTPITGATATTKFGFDFNPKADRIRVISDTGTNLRLNPNTGDLIDGDNGSTTAPLPDGVQQDGPINPAGAAIDGAAYTNNSQNATVTSLYTLSATKGTVGIQAPPNGGTQKTPLPLKVTGVANPKFEGVSGFDIPAGVNVTADDADAPANSLGYAALRTPAAGSTPALNVMALVNLTTGEVAPYGFLPAETQGLAIQSEAAAGSLPLVSLNGNTLRRFDSSATTAGAAPALTSVDVAKLEGNEAPAAIDYRPQTGQLLLLGVDDDANTGSLYILDPQTGAVTRIGTAGSVAFKAAAAGGGGATTDLPPVTKGEYDIDVNPSVDRVRVVTSSGLNFRLNPTVATGASVAVDTDAPDATNGINPDANQVVDATTGLVGGTAYTNAIGQRLPSTPAAKTTQYGISAAKDTLQIQKTPNSGVQTSPLALKTSAGALDVSAVQGFDILASATSSGPDVAATGAGVAALATGATSGLYAIDLGSGSSAKIGDLDPATTSLAVGDGPAPLKTRTTPPPAGGGTGGGTTTPPVVIPPLTPATPVKPTTPATPAKAAFGSSTRITLKLRASRVSRKGPAKVTYRNTNKFAVKARFSATTPKSGKRKAIKYSTKSFTLKASRSRTLNVKLPSAAQRVLRSKKKLTIKVTLRVTAPNGKSRNVRKTLTVRLKK